MKIDNNDPIIQNILKVLNTSSLDDWDEGKRFDDTFVEKLVSSTDIINRVSTTQEAVLLFYLFLGRYAGHERTGRNNIDIVSELSGSEEYNRRKLSYQIRNVGSFTFKCKNGDLKINRSDDIAQSQGVYSCLIDYMGGTLNITLPKNFHEPTFESRFVPFFPILCESLNILKEAKSKTKAIIFFYGDHPSREHGVAFCSNRHDDYLVPDFDMLKIFRETAHLVTTPWDSRLATAYFRGTDTGATYYKNVLNSQRAILSELSLKHPDIINSRLTGAEHPENIEKYKSIGIWGEREPQTNIFLYKYNIDVDGNSNSWVGLVNKLYMGYGGVVLKVASPDGYRQWFYDRLEPWVNFVPVAADMSDLVDKIIYLNNNNNFAESIFKNSISIFKGVTHDYLKNYAAHVISKALLGLK